MKPPSIVVMLIISAPGCAAAPGAVQNPALAAAADEFMVSSPPAAVPSDIPFESLEGPFWVADKGAATGALMFSDVVEANGPGARIYRFDPAARGFSVLPYPAPAAGGSTSTNGLGVALSGALLACERYNARLVRLDQDKLTVLADRWPAAAAGPAVAAGPAAAARPATESGQPGHPLNAPNDLIVRRDGNIYFTDSDWGARPGNGAGPMAVYRLSPGGELSRVLELQKPNGIVLSPDGNTLYVDSDAQAKIWKMSVDEAGVPGAPALFVDGTQVAGGFKVPDGICVDDAGNLYVTNNADDVRAIVVFDSSGRSLGRIRLPAAPSNCTFGGGDRRTMYVTTLHAIYEVKMPTPGLP